MNSRDQLPRNQILIGDAAKRLQEIPSASIDMVLTSPPYFRLRDYDAVDQIGLEPHVDDWVQRLLPITREIRRVLTKSGTFWLNLGDTYSTHSSQGAPRKSLLLAPERLILAMAQDGWVLRNKIVWAKSNSRPTSVKDRLSATWEPILLFAASSKPGQRTFFNLNAVRVPHLTQPPAKAPGARAGQIESWRGPNADNARGLAALKQAGKVGHPLGKNPGDVWRLASSNFRGGHHATFPLKLADRAIRAGCPEARCSRCTAPFLRLNRELGRVALASKLEPTCLCQAPSEPGIVLDPFMGAGTSAVAAEQLGRSWLGIELNPEFAELANRRIHDVRAAPKSRDKAA